MTSASARALRSVIGSVMRRLPPLTLPPLCALCGQGYASSGWVVDPIGRVSGRCHACLGDAPAARRENPGLPDVDSRVALLALMAVLPGSAGTKLRRPEPAVPPVATLIATLRLSSFGVVAG